MQEGIRRFSDLMGSGGTRAGKEPAMCEVWPGLKGNGLACDRLFGVTGRENADGAHQSAGRIACAPFSRRGVGLIK